MKFSLRLLIALASAATALAGTPDKADDAVSFPDSPSRWSLSAGASVRSIDANLHTNAPALLNWRPLVHEQGSKGYDPGLYSGGSTSVKYADGQVGPDYQVVYGSGGTPGGDALGEIDHASQVTPNVRQQSLGLGSIAEIAFHSTQSTNSYSAAGKTHGTDAADSDVGVGPYVSLSYSIFTTPDSNVSIEIGWSYVQTNHGSLLQTLGMETVTQTHTQINHTYTYDYDSGFGGGTAADPGTVFPFDATSNLNTAGYIVYNPQRYFGTPDGGGFLAPRESTTKSSTSRIIATFVPVASSSLRITSNEIVLAPKYERIIGSWFRLGLSGGVTLNVLDTAFDSSLAWYENGRSAPVLSSQWHEDDSAVKVGMMGQLTATADLTKRIFLEAHGSYRYLAPFTITSGPATARINASSWEGGLGLGLRF